MAVSIINKDVIHKTYTVSLAESSSVAPWTRYGGVEIAVIDGYTPVACFAKSVNSVNRMLANLYNLQQGMQLVVYGMGDISTSTIEVLYYKN